MNSDYLKFIPQLVSNHTINSIILTFIPGILYILAAYGHLLVGELSIGFSILVSIIFASLEYIVRVPIIKYSHEVAGMSNSTMQIVWIIITFILSKLSDIFLKSI